MDKSELNALLSKEVFTRLGRMPSFLYLWRIKLTDPSKYAIYYIRKMQYYSDKSGKIASYKAQRLHMKLVQKFGMCISPHAKIGLGLHIPHPTGIVIGNSVVIGANCSIYQNCTIGGARLGDVKKGNQPIIGDNVTLFAASMILGALSVSSNCTIAANSVLLRDANEAGVYVGSPARKV